MSRVVLMMLAGVASLALHGCGTVVDVAVGVATTAVKVTATVVETGVDVASAGVKAATSSDANTAETKP
jgi:uncharacterized protein YceK